MELSIVIPAYKEAENLDIILPKIKEAVKGIDHEIIIIDTMEAMDNTEAVCTKHAVKYFHREGGNTYGDAIRTGFQKAAKEYLLVMDADGSHSPDDFHKMFEDCADYDLTIGSRYVKGGKTDNPAILVFMSQVVNVCYRIVLGVKVKDVSNSFRVYRTKDVQKLHLDCSNFDLVEEILIKLSINNKNYRIREVPTSFKKRMYGESKRDLVMFAFSYIGSLSKLVKIKAN
ncbi:glycosyl transferase family protein [Candidatus Symbiothrix dinenymphae]|nr:glycosyl transferase family protein [Candidatus Symbiothrix dinenymphae]